MKVADLKIGQKLKALASTTTAKWLAGAVASAFVAHQTSVISFSDALLTYAVSGATGLVRYSSLKQQTVDPTSGGDQSNTATPAEGQ